MLKERASTIANRKRILILLPKEDQNVCITKSYLQNPKEVAARKKVIPGDRSYAETMSYGRKILFIGDSHVNRINKRKLNHSFQSAK